MREKRALIFVNGEIRDPAFILRLGRSGDLVIAADGGLRHVEALLLGTDILVGDLDSVKTEDVEILQEVGVPVRRYPLLKDQTDLELALDYAIGQNCSWIRIIAGLGGRMDHTLGNLVLLGDPRLENMDIRLEDGVEEVWLVRRTARIEGTPGDRVSLIPWGVPVEGITTEGLAFPLSGETLLPYRARGVSNEMTAHQAGIHMEKGQLLVIHTRRLPEEVEK